MSKPYKCIGYISVAQSANGLLYPIYNQTRLNIPFVQEIDKFGKISKFIEFTDIDEFTFSPSISESYCTVGDDGLIGIIIDKNMLEFKISVLGNMVRLGEINIDDPELPLLTKLGLSRIAKLSAHKHSEIFKNYLLNLNFDSRSIDRLNNSDQRLLTLQDTWWSDVFRSEFGVSEIASSFENSPIDDIIYWLYDNNVNEDWKDICAGLLKRVFFDERIDDILVKFIASSESFEEYDQKSKIIVGRGMDLYVQDPKGGGDFSEIMQERINDGSIFYLGNHLPEKMMQDFLRTIIQESQKDGDSTTMIDSILDYFESDVIMPRMVPVIINLLFESDLEAEYPDNSYYAGRDRFDRFIDIYRFNPSIKLWLNDESLLDTMNEIIMEIEAEEEADELYEP